MALWGGGGYPPKDILLRLVLGKVSEKKSGKSLVFCQTRGGGVSEGKQKTKPQVWKCVFFSEHGESFWDPQNTFYTWGILVKLVICVYSGHPKIKITNFMKYAIFN